MAKILIDTSVFLEWMKGEKYTAQIKTLFQNHEKCIIEWVMLELSKLIEKTLGSEVAVQYLENLQKTFTVLENNKQDFPDALVVMSKYNIDKKRLYMCDALQLVIADRLGIDLYTLNEAMTFYKPNNPKCRIINLSAQ